MHQNGRQKTPKEQTSEAARRSISRDWMPSVLRKSLCCGFCVPVKQGFQCQSHTTERNDLDLDQSTKWKRSHLNGGTRRRLTCERLTVNRIDPSKVGYVL